MSGEHQFKVGDKVRVKSTVFTEAMGMAGKIGTVTNINPLRTQLSQVSQVSFDDGSYGSAGFFASSSLEPFTLDLSTTVTPDNITMIANSSMWGSDNLIGYRPRYLSLITSWVRVIYYLVEHQACYEVEGSNSSRWNLLSDRFSYRHLLRWVHSWFVVSLNYIICSGARVWTGD